MKRLLIYICFGLLLMSCSIENGWLPSEDEEGEEMVELKIIVTTGQTRADGTSLESGVESLEVFVFIDGELESIAYSKSDSVTIRCFKGLKEVYAVVNHSEIGWNRLTTPSSLQNTVTALSDDSGCNVMFGRCQILVTDFLMNDDSSPEINPISYDWDSSDSSTDSNDAVNLVDIGTAKYVIIPVKRVGARIAIHEIKNGTSVSDGESITIHKAYITNVVGEAQLCSAISSSYYYEPDVWYNKMGNTGDLPDILSSKDMEVSIAPGETAELEQYFYCYPNSVETDAKLPGASHNDEFFSDWSPRFTRLVVEAEYKDHSSYYVISFGGVQSNCSYEVTELTIEGYGYADAEGFREIVDILPTVAPEGDVTVLETCCGCTAKVSEHIL